MEKENTEPPPVLRPSGWATYRRIMAYARPYRRHIIFGCACMGVYAGFSLVPAQALRYIIDDVIDPTAKLSIHRFLQAMGIGLGAMVAAYAGYHAFNYFGRLTMRYVGGRVVHDLRTATHRYLQSLSLEYFDSRRTGEIMSRLTADVDQVEVLVNHVIDNILINSIQTAVVLGFLFAVDWRLALVALVPVPAMIYMTKRFGKPARVRFRGARKSFGVMSAKLQDNLSGIRVIKTFNQEAHEAARFAASSDRYRKRSLDGTKISMLFGMRMAASTVTGSILVLGFGGWLVAQGQMTLGTLTAFYFMYLQPYLYSNATALANLADPILRALTSANRVFAILDAQATVKNAPDAAPSPTLCGEVEFRDVSFRYGEGGYVLSNLNLHIMPGTRAALVGKSGAGKTSFVNLVTRFYDPIEGQVLVDGVDVRAYTQESLRRQMAMVLQDVFLFNGTVKENLRYGRMDATDDEIVRACEMANAHEFIEALPDGYDTQLGERGVKLSGGQKQRLSIARAILADPKILILDEATSAVDSESEILIHEAMDRLMHGRTTFIIAHRLSTVRNADMIIGLEHGRIREIGNHEQLVALDNGIYRQLYELQQRVEAPA
jgi:ABC-type multidrug transport system fused ATPase/permease subunit